MPSKRTVGSPVFPVVPRRIWHGSGTSQWASVDHGVGCTTCPKATRPIPTTINDGCSNPPHATSNAPAPQSLGCRTWTCSHRPGIRPRSKPCRPRTAHASQSVPARSSSGRRTPANDVDMVNPPVDCWPCSRPRSLARRRAHVDGWTSSSRSNWDGGAASGRLGCHLR